MMPISVKSDDIRSGRKGTVRHGWLRAAQGSTGLKTERSRLICGLFYDFIALLLGRHRHPW